MVIEAGREIGGAASSADERWTTNDRGPSASADNATLPAAEAVGVRSRASIQFDVLRNALYHDARLRHFEWAHRTLMFLIVLSGTAGVAKLFDGSGWDRLFGAATALMATLDLVLDLRGRARLHEDLKRRYYLLLAEIEEDVAPTDTQLTRWYGRLIRITADEPVTYRAVDAAAYNEAVGALGLGNENRLKINPVRFLLRHVLTAQGMDFPPIGSKAAS